MKILRIFYLLMPVSIYLAFLYAPPAQGLGEASRIIYFHVPLAWNSTLAFIVSGVPSIIYLYDKEKKFSLIEERAHNSASIGMLFTVLTIITGSIWSKISWGMYWNWDPRETSIIILLLIYIAYFSLHSALADNPNKGRLTSSFLIFAMVTVPFFVFVVPRIYASLHPDPIINPENKMNMDGRMQITLLVSLISFTIFYFYLFILQNKISKIKQQIEEKCYEE